MSSIGGQRTKLSSWRRPFGGTAGPGLAGLWKNHRMAIEVHLQMIQAVIARLAAHSTTIKGWSVTLSGALLGYGATASTPVVAVIAAYVIIAFAVLDGYYLSLERQYWLLYQRATGENETPWLMEIQQPSGRQIITALRSPVILILYGSSLAVATAVGIYLAVK